MGFSCFEDPDKAQGSDSKFYKQFQGPKTLPILWFFFVLGRWVLIINVYNIRSPQQNPMLIIKAPAFLVFGLEVFSMVHLLG